MISTSVQRQESTLAICFRRQAELRAGRKTQLAPAVGSHTQRLNRSYWIEVFQYINSSILWILKENALRVNTPEYCRDVILEPTVSGLSTM